MSTNLEFELCATTLVACAAAARGGATRIELCRSLQAGGLTPEPALIRAAVQQSGLPVFVLLRPTADHFRFTPEIFAAMARSMDEARTLGAAGFVLGFLEDDGTVDMEHTRLLVDRALPLPVTFHRAFDETPNLAQALEAVIATGAARLLTSGGEASALAGSATLAALHVQAAGRIQLVAAAGLRPENARAVAERSHLSQFHSSLGVLEAVQDARPLWQRIERLIAELRDAHGTDTAGAGHDENV